MALLICIRMSSDSTRPAKRPDPRVQPRGCQDFRVGDRRLGAKKQLLEIRHGSVFLRLCRCAGHKMEHADVKANNRLQQLRKRPFQPDQGLTRGAAFQNSQNLMRLEAAPPTPAGDFA